MTTLPVTHWCFHLTTTETTWRGGDYDARAIVRGLKQEAFKGELRVQIKKKPHTYTSANIDEFLNIILRLIGKELTSDAPSPISIVPIPNSGMAVGEKGDFRIVKLAEIIAAGFGAGASVDPILRWNAVRQKSHKTKEFRHPAVYEPLLRVSGKPHHPVVLFDDVVTSGAQMTAAATVLRKKGFEVIRGLAIARAVSVQQPNPFLHKHTFDLEIDPVPFDIGSL
jgi:uracil phosphoribosyltransferase